MNTFCRESEEFIELVELAKKRPELKFTLVGWDGTHKGEPAPLGVYTWTFVVTMANDQVIKNSGDVTLIR